ncbi:hypothetical protein M2132_001761 [Dysgonomonas sp. PH5-45]|uniref:NigD-like protein n=1 Tax=unclassified Dysgonomonas TaxID=2630389 RepID=UPI0024731E17|nr:MULTISPECIES: NigD-like protein [unclassified Dysgonomonas]MDH6355419.1 hypothetical protein [Dysgonomonas sp. PH5-45]MDH6388316.1 hypothetical protein [Dysgonomonas sp. PH5-37]
MNHKKNTANLKTSVFSVIISVIILAFASCSSDDYKVPSYISELASVQKTDDGGYYLVMDNGTTLFPAQSDREYTVKPNQQRVLINFEYLDVPIVGAYDKAIKIYSIQDILTANVVEPESDADLNQFGNDPVEISSLWIGDSYLNIRFTFGYGETQTHSICLLNNKNTRSATDGKIHLELRHNAKNDPANYKVKTMAAFNLRPYLETEIKPVKFIVTAIGFDGKTQTFETTYDND